MIGLRPLRGGVGGGGGVLWLMIWLSSWLPFNLIIPVAGQAGLHCIQLGQNGAYTSIGAKPFKPKHGISMDKGSFHAAGNHFVQAGKGQDAWDKMTCWNPNGFEYLWTPGSFGWHESPPHGDLCGKEVDIRTYVVRQNGRVLRGWLHFEVEVTGTLKAEGIQFIYAQMRDEHWNAVGEFISNSDEQCKTDKPGIISPTEFQILPCSATGPQEAKTSGAVFMAKRDEYADISAANPYIPGRDLHLGIHFTWRLNEYWCNRHAMFRLDVHVLPANNVSKTSGCAASSPGAGQAVSAMHCRNRRVTTPWMHPEWFGAADIKLHGPLNCTNPAIVDINEAQKLTQDAKAWIKKATLVKVGSDYLGKGKEFFCQVDGIFGGYSNPPSFGGRCANYESKDPNQGTLQSCKTDESAPGFSGLDFPSYSDYKNKLLENRSILCSKECALPNKNDSQDLKNIQAFPKKDTSSAKGKAPISYTTLRNARTEQRANVLFYTRKYHGNLCILITMYLLPVSNLLIRYYKETFMHNLALGCAPWFWVHMAVCFWVPVLYQSGHASMQQSIDNFGVSESAPAKFHRRAGYFFIVVFYMSVLLGAFRPLIRATRLISMAIHSVIGFVLYFLAIILIVNSTFIPASPSAKLDECDEDGNLPSGLSFTAWMAIGWLVIDFCFHILLTVFQFAIDKKYEIVREGFGLPIVPMLPAESSRDLVGSRFRKLVLLVYIILSVAMTFMTMSSMFVNDEQGKCSLGTMSCNLDEVEPHKDSSPFGCSPISIKYYGKVILKYSTKE